MTSKDEQETTVTVGRNDSYVSVWTNDPTVVTILQKRQSVVKLTDNSGDIGGHYRIPRAEFHPLKGFKRKSKPLTPEQREAAAARLAVARAKNNEGNN